MQRRILSHLGSGSAGEPRITASADLVFISELDWLIGFCSVVLAEEEGRDRVLTILERATQIIAALQAELDELVEALKTIEFWPFDVNSTAERDLFCVKEVARDTLARLTNKEGDGA